MTASVQTYHCICANLVLATTFPFTQYRKLDKSTILPIPRLSQSQEAALAGHETQDSTDDDQDLASDSITQLVGISVIDSQAPLLIRSDEGIEKRYLLRCSRCKLTLGYQLDWDQYSTKGQFSDSVKNGRRDDVLYLLEGAVASTEAMQDL